MRIAPLTLVALLAACSDKDPGTTPDDPTTTTGPETEPTDTAITDFTDPWVPPTVDADCSAVISQDWDADGRIDGLQVNVYDPFPNLTRLDIHYGPDITDPIYYSEEYDYDASGNVTVWRLDEDYTPGWDTITTYTYDGAGLLIQVDTDYGADGTDDAQELYTWDPTGEMLLEQTADLDLDGVIDERQVHGYDADGRWILSEVDVGDDGTVDETTTVTYLAAAPSLDHIAATDDDPDPFPDYGWEAHYDADARITWYADTYDDWDSTATEYAWTYTADGDVASIEGTATSYGYPYDLTITYTWVSPGMQESMSYIVDFGFGYVFGYAEQWYWACP